MKVSELLAKPEAWTQGTSARDVNGEPVRADSEQAKAWCLYGACFKVYGAGEPYNEAKQRLMGVLGDIGIPTWNDDPYRKHAEVLDLVTRAGI